MEKRCCITGGASGLGYEFARLAASDGFHLLLIDRDLSKLDATAEELRRTFTVAVDTVHTDLSDPESCDRVYPEIKAFEPDILINNAGFGLFGLFAATGWETEKEMIHLQVVTTTCLMKQVLRDMLARGSGRIMNVASLAAFQPGPHFSVYSASKAYIRSLTLAVATEIRGSGVTLSLFCPGQTRTGFAQAVARRSGSRECKVPLFSSEARPVAAIGYRGMMKGKTVIIPGFNNRIIAAMSHFLPASVASRINGRIQTRIRK